MTTPAIVLQASGPNALGIIRSLARAGIPVIACDHDPRALGMISRHVRPHVLPDPLGEEEGFLAGLKDLGAGAGAGGVLFATHDEALSAIGPNEAEIDAVFRRPWSPWTRLEPLLDKSHQHAVAREIGFPVPETVEPSDEGDVRAAAGHLRFPVILKPREAPEFRRRFRTQVIEADDPESLMRGWELAAPYDPQISEVIPGGDDALWTLGSYRDVEGRPLGSFTGHKLRQWPPRFGTARAAEALWDPGLARRGHALLDALDWHGISQVEVKRDPRDGRDYLIEVNPRSWLWISLATACGVNLPAICHHDALGDPPAAVTGHGDGRRWVLGIKHLGASAREIRAGSWSARELAATLRPPLTDGVFDLRDPKPALVQARRILSRGRGGG